MGAGELRREERLSLPDRATRPWRDDPDLPPRWRAFGEALVAARPDWEPHILGAVAAYHPGYGEDDVRFVVEIPSAHPTIADPLVAELADPEYQEHIDVYWDGAFEHIVGRGLSQEAHFARAIDLLREIVDEERLFFERRGESGRPTHGGWLLAPLERPLAEVGAERGGGLRRALLAGHVRRGMALGRRVATCPSSECPGGRARSNRSREERKALMPPYGCVSLCKAASERDDGRAPTMPVKAQEASSPGRIA